MTEQIIKVRKTHCKGNSHGGRASLFKNQLVLPKLGNPYYTHFVIVKHDRKVA